MNVELTKAAENYLSAIVKGQIPKTRGAAGLAVQRKLIQAGLLTEKGNPTKKAKTYFETPEGPIAPPELKEGPILPAEDHIPVYDEDDEDRIIGYMEPEESTGMKIYDLYLLVGTERENVGFTSDENSGIARIRLKFRKLFRGADVD